MDLPGVDDLRCSPGSKGSSCTEDKGKNKAEGCSGPVCTVLQQRHWQLSAVGVSVTVCRSPTGGKWAQLSAMRAQGRQAGRAAQRSAGSGTAFEASRRIE